MVTDALGNPRETVSPDSPLVVFLESCTPAKALRTGLRTGIRRTRAPSRAGSVATLWHIDEDSCKPTHEKVADPDLDRRGCCEPGRSELWLQLAGSADTGVGVGWGAGAGRTPMRQYHKGSVLILRIPVSRMVDAEDMLLQQCRYKFLQRKDFGHEYFEGKRCLLIKTTAEVAELFHPDLTCLKMQARTNSITEQHTTLDQRLDMDGEACMDPETGTRTDTNANTHLETGGEQPEAPTKVCTVTDTESVIPTTDATVLLLQHINLRLAKLDGPVNTAHLLHDITIMYRKEGCRSSPTLKSLFRDLKHYFKCTESPQHVFPDGRTGHATCFPVSLARTPSCAAQNDPAVSMKSPCAMASFFALEDDKRGCTIEYVQGAVTWEIDFKAFFERAMSPAKYKQKFYEAVIVSHGYRRSADRVNMCLACKGFGRVGCCADSNRDFRRPKSVLYDLVLRPCVIASDGADVL